MSALVHIIDHDIASQAAINRMLRACGYRTKAYICADDILSHKPDEECASCVVIDTVAPDESVPDIVGQFNKAGLNLPVIFLTDRSDMRGVVRAIKAGAEDFFVKPFEPDEFISAIDRAVSRQQHVYEQEEWARETLAHLKHLTKREREVFDLVIRGKMNKQIAFALGTTDRTIKAHRHKVMEKMQARSIIELVSCAERLGLLRPTP